MLDVLGVKERTIATLQVDDNMSYFSPDTDFKAILKDIRVMKVD